jgi:hypothetical protein
MIVEQYIHMLIARDDNFVPRPAQVSAFVAAMVQLQVIPELEKMYVRTPSTKVRTGTNPFTGETVSFPMRDFTYLKDPAEITSAVNGKNDYDAAIEGIGRPTLPPINITLTDPYAIAISCRVTSEPRSTSGVYSEETTAQHPVPFNKPCPELAPYGYFTDPTTSEIIKVADAGRAQFWIEFELGKWLFPTLENGNLEIINPMILACAAKEFGISFAQGCHYY